MALVADPRQEGEASSETKATRLLRESKGPVSLRIWGVLGGKVDSHRHWGHVGAAQSALFGALHVCTSRASRQSWQRTAQHQWNLHSHLVIRVTRDVS